MTESLDSRLHRIEAELDALAQEAWQAGYVIIVNSHDGAIVYHDPKYPKLIPYRLRRRTISLLHTGQPEPEGGES